MRIFESMEVDTATNIGRNQHLHRPKHSLALQFNLHVPFLFVSTDVIPVLWPSKVNFSSPEAPSL